MFTLINSSTVVPRILILTITLIFLPLSVVADVYRCRLDSGALLYTDLGCYHADVEKRYRDANQLVPRKTLFDKRQSPSKAERRDTKAREHGFSGYDHFRRSLSLCHTLPTHSDLWRDNRCGQALDIANDMAINHKLRSN